MNDLDKAAEFAANLFVSDNFSRADAIESACDRFDILLCDDVYDEMEEKMSDILAGDR